ncbi:gas vesicle protein GvpO [Actinoallomurus soli]|uniref:gas vesicle protein GvpO n=1 Tax=Actinoallomurus soli TaxID=2952535 RepID=UPI002092E341|nr:gas vesicle protein [Actinoallomurus soli]MCO5967587.1 gas vesicle protein [Actinoallomurus soli]
MPQSRSTQSQSGQSEGGQSQNGRNQSGRSGGRSGSGRRKKGLAPEEVARTAVEHVVEMTGRESEGVIALERTDDGWKVGVEVVESGRIPDTNDILAVYEAELDDEGNLLSYRRTARYYRGRFDRDKR